jgi:hypothetical protein
MYSRDISKLEKWVGAWISADTKSFSSKPTILWPTDFWPIANVAQQELVEGFVVDLEKTHGVKRTEVSIKDLWKKKTPKEADSSDIEEYLKDVREEFWISRVELMSCRLESPRSAMVCMRNSRTFVTHIARSIPKSPMSTRLCAGDGEL